MNDTRPTIVRDLPPPPEEETPGVENSNNIHQARNNDVHTIGRKFFPSSVEDDEALARRLQAEWDANDAATSTSTTTPIPTLTTPQNQAPGSSSAAAAAPGSTHSVATLSNPWEFDVEQRHCTTCNDEFNAFNRRHHCRLCGKIFCHRCSDQRTLVPPSAIVLTPSKGGKKAQPPPTHQDGNRIGFSPDPDPDRMLTYIDEEKQLLYGKGLEER
jgi:hypothetical protein